MDRAADTKLPKGPKHVSRIGCPRCMACKIPIGRLYAGMGHRTNVGRLQQAILDKGPSAPLHGGKVWGTVGVIYTVPRTLALRGMNVVSGRWLRLGSCQDGRSPILCIRIHRGRRWRVDGGR